MVFFLLLLQVLYQMKMGENIVTVPTIGFNVEEVANTYSVLSFILV